MEKTRVMICLYSQPPPQSHYYPPIYLTDPPSFYWCTFSIPSFMLSLMLRFLFALRTTALSFHLCSRDERRVCHKDSGGLLRDCFSLGPRALPGVPYPQAASRPGPWNAATTSTLTHCYHHGEPHPTLGRPLPPRILEVDRGPHPEHRYSYGRADYRTLDKGLHRYHCLQLGPTITHMISASTYSSPAPYVTVCAFRLHGIIHPIRMHTFFRSTSPALPLHALFGTFFPDL